MNKAVILILILSMITLSLGCIDSDNKGTDNNNNEDNQQINYFELSITLDNPENYTIFVPIPLSSGRLTELANKIETSEYNFNIIESEHGKCLKIKENNNISLYLESNESQAMALSMVEKDESGYGNLGNWIFYSGNNSNLTISISLIETNIKGTFVGKQWFEDYYLVNGWQLVEFENDAQAED